MFSKRQQSGFVLLVTVIIAAVVTTIVLASSQTVVVSNKVLSHRIGMNKANHTAKSAINYALGIINNNEEAVNIQGLVVNIDGTLCELNINCDNGKINLNNLIRSEGNSSDQYITIISNMINSYNISNTDADISLDLIPSAIDAIDENDDVERVKLNGKTYIGGESKYYRQKNLPICKNQKFIDISEIYFIKNFKSDNNSGVKKFIDCLTVKNTDKIDINSASPDVISAIGYGISPIKAKQLSVIYQDAKYNTVAEFIAAAELDVSESNNLAGILTVSPKNKYYTVTAKCTIKGHIFELMADISVNDKDIYVIKAYKNN